MPLPTDAAGLILFLLNIGITLSEQDQEKIRANVLADKAAADEATDRNRELDPPAVILTTFPLDPQVGLLATAAASVPPDASTSIWLLLATTILTFVFQCYRESRDRRWKREDQEKQDAREKRDAADKKRIAELVIENQRLVAKHAAETKRDLGGMIKENTSLTREGIEKSEKAIQVGNNFNEKLAEVKAQAETVAAQVKQ